MLPCKKKKGGGGEMTYLARVGCNGIGSPWLAGYPYVVSTVV